MIGDYEDSDLCLKIPATGRKIAYVPDVELYHLERKSMSLNAEYMRGIAWQYNCALHSDPLARSSMTAIMQPSARPRRDEECHQYECPSSMLRTGNFRPNRPQACRRHLPFGI